MAHYFNDREFACKCSDRACPGKRPEMNATLVQGLNRLREVFGGPLVVTSALRCPEHNKAVGGAPSSYHLRGMAVDVRPASGKAEDLARLWMLAHEEAAFTGLGDGLARGFIHLDVRPLRPGEARKKWLY